MSRVSYQIWLSLLLFLVCHQLALSYMIFWRVETLFYQWPSRTIPCVHIYKDSSANKHKTNPLNLILISLLRPMILYWIVPIHVSDTFNLNKFKMRKPINENIFHLKYNWLEFYLYVKLLLCLCSWQWTGPRSPRSRPSQFGFPPVSLYNVQQPPRMQSGRIQTLPAIFLCCIWLRCFISRSSPTAVCVRPSCRQPRGFGSR